MFGSGLLCAPFAAMELTVVAAFAPDVQSRVTLFMNKVSHGNLERFAEAARKPAAEGDVALNLASGDLDLVKNVCRLSCRSQPLVGPQALLHGRRFGRHPPGARRPEPVQCFGGAAELELLRGGRGPPRHGNTVLSAI